jgi:transcriptional regulator with XRE-family HTH domain
MSKFAHRFNSALEMKALSRRELARLSGVHVNTLNNWAGGEVPNPHPEPLKKVASCLGVSYEWLRTGEGDMAPPASPEKALRAAERLVPGGSYRHEKRSESPFDPELMEQVVRLVEDYARLFRKQLGESQRVELMERAYQLCLEAGFTGRPPISMSQFQKLLKTE